MFLESGVRCGSGERCRFQQNWFVLTTYCTLVGFAYSSALPSLHQFVTSSTHPEDSDVSLMHRKCQCTMQSVCCDTFVLSRHTCSCFIITPGTAWSRTKWVVVLLDCKCTKHWRTNWCCCDINTSEMGLYKVYDALILSTSCLWWSTVQYRQVWLDDLNRWVCLSKPPFIMHCT